MNGDVLVFAQVMTIIVASTGAFVAIGLGARMLWRAGSRMKQRMAPSVDDSRLARPRAAVGAHALEVETTRGPQRYTVGLLSARLPARTGDRAGELPASGSLKRVNTPH